MPYVKLSGWVEMSTKDHLPKKFHVYRKRNQGAESRNRAKRGWTRISSLKIWIFFKKMTQTRGHQWQIPIRPFKSWSFLSVVLSWLTNPRKNLKLRQWSSGLGLTTITTPFSYQQMKLLSSPWKIARPRDCPLMRWVRLKENFWGYKPRLLEPKGLLDDMFNFSHRLINFIQGFRSRDTWRVLPSASLTTVVR
jgi:hypothetical protein